MKMLPPTVFIFFVSIVLARAQAEGQKELEFRLLRQNDLISIPLENQDGFYENLKRISLGHRNSLSFGGSYRVQSEAFVNEQFSSEVDQNDIWFLNRIHFHSHLKLGNKFELFAELNSSLITSKQNLAPVDRDELSVNQLFARYHFNSNWDILVGRQNMRLGSGRLVDVREGPNVRLSFDMVQLQYQDANTELTAFYALPVRVGQGVFDNEALDFQESVGAVYWTQHWNANSSTDIYAFYKDEETKTWNSGTGDDNRLSLGLRHFGNERTVFFHNLSAIATALEKKVLFPCRLG